MKGTLKVGGVKKPPSMSTRKAPSTVAQGKKSPFTPAPKSLGK